jgi:RimJ/RimL family protein N-acetyltransferase
MQFEDDMDVAYLIEIYKMPEIAKYLSISDNYFHYVTNTENVYFYKVYENDKFIGTIHLEKQETVLFMSILVFREFQRIGLGTQIVKDIQNDVFGLDFDRIEISIDETNSASLRLFEKAGFTFVSKEDEILNFIYQSETV